MAKKAAKKTTSTKTKSASKRAGAPAIRPLGEKVLIERLEAEERTAGGLVLPDTAKEKPQRGTVLALGDGRMLDSGDRADFQVKKGDTVLFASFAGTDIKYEGREYLLMDESDILAVLD